MYVVKRDGRRVPVHFDKITARITKLCYGLNPDFCDPVRSWLVPCVRAPVAGRRGSSSSWPLPTLRRSRWLRRHFQTRAPLLERKSAHQLI